MEIPLPKEPPGAYTSPLNQGQKSRVKKGPCNPIVAILKRSSHLVMQIEHRIDPYKKFKPWSKRARQPRPEAKEILYLIQECLGSLTTRDKALLAQEKAVITRDMERTLSTFEARIQQLVLDPLKVIFQTEPPPTPSYGPYLAVIRDVQEKALKALENVGIPETVKEEKDLEHEAEREDVATQSYAIELD